MPGKVGGASSRYLVLSLANKGAEVPILSLANATFRMPDTSEKRVVGLEPLRHLQEGS